MCQMLGGSGWNGRRTGGFVVVRPTWLALKSTKEFRHLAVSVRVRVASCTFAACYLDSRAMRV